MLDASILGIHAPRVSRQLEVRTVSRGKCCSSDRDDFLLRWSSFSRCIRRMGLMFWPPISSSRMCRFPFPFRFSNCSEWQRVGAIFFFGFSVLGTARAWTNSSTEVFTGVHDTSPSLSDRLSQRFKSRIAILSTAIINFSHTRKEPSYRFAE